MGYLESNHVEEHFILSYHCRTFAGSSKEEKIHISSGRTSIDGSWPLPRCDWPGPGRRSYL